MTESAVNFPGLIAEFRALDKPYTKKQLADPNWVIKEIARLGYSIFIRHQTAEGYLAQVKEIGKADPDSAFIREHYDTFKKLGGMYSYRLTGGILYPTEEDGHGVNLCTNLEEAVLVALYNIVKGEAELPRDSNNPGSAVD